MFRQEFENNVDPVDFHHNLQSDGFSFSIDLNTVQFGCEIKKEISVKI